MNHTVDVIIPVYNAEKYIENTLASVLNQTYPIANIILVDDGSKDNSCMIIENISSGSPNFRITLIKKLNGGRASAVNAGIKASTSDYIAFLDADDIWLPQKIEKQISVFENNETTDVVYCDYEVIDQNDLLKENATTYRAKPRLKGKVFKNLALHGNRVSGSNSAVIIRRERIQDLYLDESLYACEDWDLWMKLGKNHNFDFVDEILVRIKQHCSNLSSDAFVMLKYDLLTLKNHLCDLNQYERFRASSRCINTKGIKIIWGHWAEILSMNKMLGRSKIETFVVLLGITFYKFIRKICQLVFRRLPLTLRERLRVRC